MSPRGWCADDGRGWQARIACQDPAFLAALLAYGSQRPHFPTPVHSGDLMAYRLGEQGYDYVSLAEVAPVLGIDAAVPVADSRWYEGVVGVTVVEQPA